MASLSASSGTSLPTLSSLPRYSQCPFSPKTYQLKSTPRNRNPNYKAVTGQARRNDEIDDPNPSRRDLLIGLGGLYTAASNDPYALADAIKGPNLDNCQPTIKVRSGELSNADRKYCLIKKEPKPFVMDPPNPTVKLRRAAHGADDVYYAKFEKAINIMRHLAPDDPRSFDNQATIHAAYCNRAYLQNGFDKEFQVHDSAFFFPFHRWYLYFFERICAHYADDPDFRLPFWNWDSPLGMTMPERYTRVASPLYDEFRDPEHTPTGKYTTVSLQLPLKEEDKKKFVLYGEDQPLLNRATMFNAMVTNSKTAADFFGPMYKAGEANPGSGSGGAVESGPHTAIHIWTGNPKLELNPHMGSFHTAARDPLFYAHHANVDRMWDIWKSGLIPGCGTRKDLTDEDWLNTEFLFYDENADMVRVTVGGCLDSANLGYSYDLTKETIPWLECPKKPKESTASYKLFSNFFAKVPALNIRDQKIFPVKLDEVVEFTVDRPSNKKRSDEEKARKDEVLVVQNICVGSEEDYVKFDVFVNDDDYRTTTPLNFEFAGSFAALEPAGHIHGDKERMNMRGADLCLSLTEILEALGAENDMSIDVALVPQVGCREVTFDGIKIEYRDIS